MSTFYPVKVKCAMCGKESEHTRIGSTSAFGPMDLDTRPPALERYTIGCKVQMCPSCGYAIYNLEVKAPVEPEFLQSEAYQTTNGHKMNDLATAFYRQGLIYHECNDAVREFVSYLHAAWACDDAHEHENAVTCRLAALHVMDTASTPIYDEEATNIIMKLDLLRRTRQFDKVLEYRDTKLETEFLQSLLDYEITLAEKQDPHCHTVEDAENGGEEVLLVANRDITVGTEITIRVLIDAFTGMLVDEAAEYLEESDELDMVIGTVRKDIPGGVELTEYNIEEYIEPAPIE